MSQECKYPRGKIKFHTNEVIENLDVFKDVLEDNDLCLEELSFKDTFSELKEIVSRFIPQKPNGIWVSGWGPGGAPRCPCCGARLKRGRNVHCHKCGQLIDWTEGGAK